ncbi:ChaN family lipoprotein [Roseovarius sp. Pro17]|uniref:ChaN family lipoprotein n=1 Tax=Roseovarius sp. Pro17 TaxID=3108175 RepID=UPI002D78C727|nr:ChaN family lipoprotein [Roseovarius sp. Pro17]
MRLCAFWATALALLASPVGAQDVLVLGEVHDNPAHHAVQAARVAEFAPQALVFEMLTPDQATRVTPELRGDADALAAALDWGGSGWPDFSYYYPIFVAAPQAQVHGAGVPREDTRTVAEQGLGAAFGEGAKIYGLTAPLTETQQSAREALQASAHCDALPPEMLPMMVDIQRLRDATLARATMQALDQTGGPVAVITGNGHARSDWGMPALLARAAPMIEIYTLGQGEDGAVPDGIFDEVIIAPAPERDDPCKAFE